MAFEDPQTRHVDDPEGLEPPPLPEWHDEPAEQHHVDDPPEQQEPS